MEHPTENLKDYLECFDWKLWNSSPYLVLENSKSETEASKFEGKRHLFWL